MLNINDIKNKIFNAYSNDLLCEFPNDIIDLVVTSPPYDDLRDYEGKIVWNMDIFKKIANEIYRILKPGGVVVWVIGDRTLNGNRSLTSFKQALYFQEIGFNMYDIIIYEKAGSGPPHPNRYFNTYEFMFVLSKGKPKTVNLLKDKPNKWAGATTYGEVTRREKDGSLTNKGKKTIQEFGVRTNIWRYANGNGYSTKDKIAYLHPAIFPEKLVEDHILSWSNPGDLILDPFGGSGTTAKVATILKRDWVLIEAVKEYCDIAEKRLAGITDANDNN
ncbi:site-specific DNA-methyltransferase (adenine-specific) [Herbinix hemicellulosilytica]|uniref:Methyltransferase n=1 Tax=Herbinix hemicellulosilytica TaxID=1564487 RepID=A0A0H5SJ73_HERHM|nr:site-specific DNA-methyltransferase [Herbinix hemicellulosilytica]RBP58628.1 site-specific DNA-methyltransferase (adenine-specific) [Herbinix hemicellulosilytica]CRZ35552.1 Modification methylase BamHII [Herbinix hemicellulosilytica]